MLIVVMDILRNVKNTFRLGDMMKNKKKKPGARKRLSEALAAKKSIKQFFWDEYNRKKYEREEKYKNEK